MKLQVRAAVVIAVMLVAATALATLRGQNQQARPPKEQAPDEHPPPVVDFSDRGKHEKDAKRRAKGKRYDNGGVVANGVGLQAVTHFDDWSFRVMELPVSGSSLIVTGLVIDARTYLSPDGSGVYTENNVRVDEVLKDSAAAVAVGDTITVDRVGGRVRYPSGDIVTYAVAGQGALRTGRRYILFLERTEENLNVITGYELQGKQVRPLDHAQKFKKYEGINEDSLLNQVREAGTPPASGTPNLRR